MLLSVLVPVFLFQLITLMYHAGVAGLRRMNVQLAIITSVARPRSHLRRASSDSSLYVGHFSGLRSYDDVSGSIANSSFCSEPATPKVPFDGERFGSSNSSSNPSPFPVDFSDEEYWSSTVQSSPGSSTSKSSESSKDPAQVEGGGKVGLALVGNLLAEDEEVQKLNRKVLSGAISKSFKNTGQRFSASESIKIRHDWPCVFAPELETANVPHAYYSKLIVNPDSVTPPDCKSHAAINKEASAACFPPLTFCSSHKNAGYLKLEDIEQSEYYTRVDVNLPFISKVTHRFNGCVLEFPPADTLILFNNKNGAVGGDVEDVSAPVPGLSKMDELDPIPELPEVDEPAGPRSLHNRFCLDCGRRLSGGDLYLYRQMAFCSEDCRFFNTLEAVLQKSIETTYLENEEPIADDKPQESSPSSSCSPPHPLSRNDKGKGVLYIG